MNHRKKVTHGSDKTDLSSSARPGILLLFLAVIFYLGWISYKNNSDSPRFYSKNDSSTSTSTSTSSSTVDAVSTISATLPVFDAEAYDKKMLSLANLTPIKVESTASSSTTTPTYIQATSSRGWPVQAAYPKQGALLPFNRIVAYYGNFYSKKMGVLGEYPTDVVISKLQEEVKKWNLADPFTPAIPAIHYIAAVAQADAGRDGDYLARMPHEEIDKAVSMAEEVKGIMFLDLQMGHSTVVEEVRAIEKYLSLPQVHLGLDPEFAMKTGKKPGVYIGSLDASEINQAAEILAKIVRDNNLPPKMLLIHRFTDNMVTNVQNIKPLPEVQIIMDMDGWGSPELKKATYRQVITREPVQFSGVKIFYKNDLRAPSTRLLTPEEILMLRPQPSYIQYQ